MAKLVILNAGMTGRSHELTADKTTIGRVDDNTFPITDPSVSSHHCEITLKGSEVVVHDLNSTNGTFINGDKVTDATLQPGQVLRIGQVELRLESEGSTAAPASASSAPAAAGAAKKAGDATMQRGVSLTDLEQSTRGGFDTAGPGFSKKDNKANKIFLYVAIGVGVLIVGFLLYAFFVAKSGP